MKRLSMSLCVCGLLSLSLSAAASAQQVRWPSELPPRPLPAHSATFPPYEIQTLPNGLQVMVVLHHEQPSISMRLLVRAGSASDPKDKVGLANLLASVLDQGTTSKSAAEIADSVDFIGGGLSVGAGTDLSFVNMVVMNDSFESGMRMLSDVARNPAFAPEEIERQKQQALSGLQVSNDDPAYVADSVFDRLVYGFHPYGLPGTGTPEAIDSITRDDLFAFHRKYFIPNNAILAVVGDVTAEDAFATAKKVFGDWPQRDYKPDTYMAPPEPARRVIVINKPDAVQTEVRVGHLGIPRKDRDYLALDLATRILGGEGANRLHQVLRTDRGLTYGAQADLNALKDSGDIEAETNTRSEATGEVVRLMIDEFWRLQREPVGEAELESAKAYLTGNFPLTIETPGSIALQVLNVVFYGLPLEQLQNFRDRVNAVTVDDIQRVARMYLKPDRLSIVLVGNAAAFTSQLKGIGLPQFDTVQLEDLDLTAPNLARPRSGAQLALPADAPNGGPEGLHYISLQQAEAPKDSAGARALLDRMIAAKGGLETLRAVKTITATATEVVANAPLPPHDDGASHFVPHPTTADTVTYLAYPNQMRQETRHQAEGDEADEDVVISGFDGRNYWMGDPRRTTVMPDAYTRQVQLKFTRDVISALLAAHDGRLNMRVLPDVKDESGELRHALELSGTGVDPFILLADRTNGLIAKQVYVGQGRDRPLVEELFSDYRAVDGVQVAFRAIMRQGGQQLVDRRITDVKINTPLAPSLFKRPVS